MAAADAQPHTIGYRDSDWKFLQVFGEESPNSVTEAIQDADLLSALDFDETGDYLATGDRGGRIVVFERGAEDPQQGCVDMDIDVQPAPNANQDSRQYRFLTEFQSHEPEFDYLKSLEIEEKINSIRWCRGAMGCKLLLSTNDKTIRLWKIYGKKIKAVSEMNVDTSTDSSGGMWLASTQQTGNPAQPPSGLEHRLRLPRVSTCERVVTATPKRAFSNAHAYHINSIALCPDGETFLSCDDLRLNLWNLHVTNRCFNVVDVKPSNMEALSHVITSADFHPTQCSTFIYSCSRGSVRLGDLRSAALCDQSTKQFELKDSTQNKSFFSEITSSISSARFSPDGRFITIRDYLTTRVWDVNMESRPLHVFPVHEHLRPKLCDLYERDCIFDKFDCAFSHDSKQIVTGSYGNTFHMLSTEGEEPDVLLEASQDPYRRHAQQVAANNGAAQAPEPPSDFGRRTLHAAFHPNQPLCAVAATSTLFIFRR